MSEFKRYDEKPRWVSLFDPVDLPLGARDRERELSHYKNRIDETVREVQNLERNLSTDEDGELDYRAEQHLAKAAETVRDAMEETHSYAATLSENFQKAVDEVEILTDMLIELLNHTGGVMISEDHQEVLEWSRENLIGDWEYLVYKQNQCNPPILRHIYILTDDTDRVTFKLRWA